MKKIIFILMLFFFLALTVTALILDGINFFAWFDHGKRLAGLLALVFLAFQFVLSARIRVIEQGLGQDTLIRLHRISGVLGLILAFIHGALDSVMRIQHFGAVTYEFPYDLPRFLGFVAILLLLVVAVPSLFVHGLKIPYHLWIKIHKISYPMFPILLIHALLLGTTIRFQPLALTVWIVCALLYGVTVVNRLVLWAQKIRNPYHVTHVVRETHDTVSIFAKGKPKHHIPGQFIFLQVKQGKKISSVHPFTLSSSPDAETIRISVKAIGDFTSNLLPNLKKGDELLIDGPYGWFSYIRFPSSFELVFLAGGIGITPFLSMLTFLAQHDPLRTITLIWGNKTLEDIGFTHDIDHCLTSLPHCKIIHVLSNQDLKEGSLNFSQNKVEYETGYITQELLYKTKPDWSNTGVMVCGPPIMMSLVHKYTKKLGIPDKHVIMEKFSL